MLNDDKERNDECFHFIFFVIVIDNLAVEEGVRFTTVAKFA
jgi:hypothetical protein